MVGKRGIVAPGKCAHSAERLTWLRRGWAKGRCDARFRRVLVSSRRKGVWVAPQTGQHQVDGRRTGFRDAGIGLSEPCSVTRASAARCRRPFRYLAWRAAWSCRPRGVAWYRRLDARWFSRRAACAQGRPQKTWPRSHLEHTTALRRQRSQVNSRWLSTSRVRTCAGIPPSLLRDRLPRVALARATTMLLAYWGWY